MTTVTKVLTPSSRLRKSADGLQKQIDYKLNPGVAQQNPTRRRVQMVQHMRQEGIRLEQIQTILRKIADAYDGLGPWPQPEATARAIRSKPDVEKLRPEVRDQLAEKRQLTPAEQARHLSEGLVGSKIPGFFPTPADLADDVVSRLGTIKVTSRILEPSAGTGALIDALPTGVGIVEACEVNYTLREILKAKGITLRPEFDCMDIKDPVYDKILMNPPFENGQDIAHVQHLYQHALRPCGTLVAIISNAYTFRREVKFEEFRAFLRAVDANESDIIEEAFTGAQAFRQTSVPVRIVTIHKAID